ncbi:uncharacterized protein [Drosophila kikkawai]|uniref:C2H2-type domain-containing protein n=1 Tax=Drosophila kikkawai TaxID=30033 RepID=A0ABM3C5E4_DROKI|nr:uncharacterized protein LOC121502168 [Drosophila kikkawai]
MSMSINRQPQTQQTPNKVNGSNSITDLLDRTENDATHPILRSDHRHQGELVQCLTCHMQFESCSFSDICAHYTFYHNNNYNQNNTNKCLYCDRDVHYYQRAEKTSPAIYHFCSPRKQN